MTDLSKVFTVKGSYSFGPRIQYSGSAWREITSFVKTLEKEDTNEFMLPADFEDQLAVEHHHITRLVKDLVAGKKGGLAYMSTCLAAEAGLTTGPPSPDVLCDALVISRSDVPYLLTFSKDTVSPLTRQYNLTLAKGLLKKLRVFVDEDFTFAFGVVGPHDTESFQSFRKSLLSVKNGSTRYAIRRYLTMTESKWQTITIGLVTMLAVGCRQNCNGYGVKEEVIQVGIDQNYLRNMICVANG